MNNSKKIKIGICGFGNMGQAIFSILTKDKKLGNKEIYINSSHIESISSAICVATIEDLLNNCNVIFICIKPQDFYKLAVDKNISQKSSAIIISIMAGVTIGNIKKILPTKKVVRTMPNLALQIQEAVIGWHAEKNNFSKEELQLTNNLLNSFGLTIFTKKEDMLNALTAISGSGPAYIFLFINALMKSAKSLGFSEKEARRIVFQTMKGSMDYAQEMEEIPLDNLIKKVTSKKGTTEAALKKINILNFYKKWQQATLKAYERAKKISDYNIK